MSGGDLSRAPLRIVVLASGRGTNLQSLIDHCNLADPPRMPATVSAVIVNRPGAGALTRAEDAGIPTRLVDHKTFATREAFDATLAEEIEAFSPNLIVLAGFMRILTPGFIERFSGRAINIHPSLLPKYPGLHTHQRALDAKDSHHGATVHFVSAGVDEGPIIIQGQVPVLPSDDADTLAARVLESEHRLLPQAVKWFAEGRVTLADGVALLDSQPAARCASLVDF